MAILFGVPDEKRGALRSRLKQFQRLGLPIGINVGVGLRSNYTVESVMQVALGLTLLDQGFATERMANTIATHWRMIKRELSIAACHSEANYIACHPRGLDSIRSQHDLSMESEVNFGSLAQIDMIMSSETKEISRDFTAVNLSGLVADTAEALAGSATVVGGDWAAFCVEVVAAVRAWESADVVDPEA